MERDAERLVQLAMQDLARRMPVTRGEIKVTSVRARDFRDASLGVRERNRMYAQVITPGYVIRLDGAGKHYTYHGAGVRVVLAKGKVR